MENTTLEGTYVAIYDWHGRVTWISGKETLAKEGDLAWEHLAEELQDGAKQVFSRVVTLRETATVEAQNQAGDHFRIWLWPLHSPEAAVCTLAIRIPKELSLLTEREREVLGLLATGHAVRDIVIELDVSASTVHTHLRKARTKLCLPNLESLTGFAAKYCHPHAAPGPLL